MVKEAQLGISRLQAREAERGSKQEGARVEHGPSVSLSREYSRSAIRPFDGCARYSSLGLFSLRGRSPSASRLSSPGSGAGHIDAERPIVRWSRLGALSVTLAAS